eukprot:s1055_g22.t1
MEGDLNLQIPIRQRVEEVEATKCGQEEGADSQAKFVQFDPNTAVAEPSPKQPRTALYSPTYAGNLQSESSATRHVRRVVEELELYDEDEVEQQLDEELWGWEFCEKADALESGMIEISDEDQRKRGFYNAGAGPPEVSPEEFAWLDFEAMQMELDRLRLRDLDVIGAMESDVNTDDCVKLDTRLVRDWRFRESKWKRRARLVAREFRGNDCSSAFSPTTPLAFVKMFIVRSILHGLAIASLDVGDAFLQVPQLATLLIEIPKWALQAGVHGGGSHFWTFKRCLPGQRAAASEWNKFFIEVCGCDGFQNIQGTIFKHKEELAYISVRIDDLLVVGTKSFINDFHEKLSKELKLKIGGPFKCGDEASSTSNENFNLLKKESTWVQDMKLFYSKVELRQTTMQRWYGAQKKQDSKPHTVELFSDSDLASCKVSRRSTSSGLIFLNSCLIHSHSRSQTSVSLSSMEAEILAATSLLTEGIYVKQVLQFLVNDTGGLGNQDKVSMRLRLDSTSAQAFFARLGPGKAEHWSTRLLWTQQAMRRNWFAVDRISTKENPVDLHTKPLSRERREFLMRRIGLVSETFGDEEEATGEADCEHDHGKYPAWM